MIYSIYLCIYMHILRVYIHIYIYIYTHHVYTHVCTSAYRYRTKWEITKNTMTASVTSASRTSKTDWTPPNDKRNYVFLPDRHVRHKQDVVPLEYHAAWWLMMAQRSTLRCRFKGKSKHHCAFAMTHHMCSATMDPPKARLSESQYKV